MSLKSGIIWTLAALLAASAAGADGGAVRPAAGEAIVPGGDYLLPRLTPAVQLSRPADVAILVAQARQDSSAKPRTSRAPASHKSPKRAFLLSAVVPGSGEFWAGSKARAALFFGLEVAGLGTYVSWNGKGKDLEDEFRVRADSTYNPWNYLAWRDSRQSRFSSITHALPCSSYVASAPSSTPVPDAVRRCPGSDKQQFYELIGKYDQFVSGWADVRDGWDHEAKEWEDPGTPGNRVEYSMVDSAENFQSATRLSYEVDRNESNKYLKRASNVLGLILVNHVISAIDAARVTRARNEGQDEAILNRRTRFGVALGGSSGTTPMLLAVRPFD